MNRPDEVDGLDETALGIVRRADGRERPSLDFERAAAFIGAIPTGRWAAYKDVATAAGNQDAAGGYR